MYAERRNSEARRGIRCADKHHHQDLSLRSQSLSSATHPLSQWTRLVFARLDLGPFVRSMRLGLFQRTEPLSIRIRILDLPLSVHGVQGFDALVNHI
jgi:hypothetical protein